MTAPEIPGRFFIMRHGETVFNAARRLQGDEAHTPLTRAGVEQALAMGEHLRGVLGDRPTASVHVSETGRTLQTAALVLDVLGLSLFDARRDLRLVEIGMGCWGGRYYHEVEGEVGAIVDAEHLLTPAPDGEDYPAIAARLNDWLDEVGDAGGDHIVIMHGISSRVLRGIMTGLPDHPRYRAPIAPGLVQGSIVMIEDGRETLVHGATHGVMHA